MTDRAAILCRLDQIRDHVRNDPDVEALLGFGSVAEPDRLDDYSDLDLLVVAATGRKSELVDRAAGFPALAPVALRYRHTPDGWKILYEDGVLCDFGIAYAHELPGFPHSAGRVLWGRGGFDEALASATVPETGIDIDREVNEILISLYVGLLRFRRGEKLAGCFEVQHRAVSRLVAVIRAASPGSDPFQPDRRFELDCPTFSRELASIMQGYEHTPESALTILRVARRFANVPAAFDRMIEQLASEA